MGDARRKKYPVPDFLPIDFRQPTYDKWLDRKAASHIRRDRNRGNTTATKATYKVAIHEAVVRCNGLDEYTGKRLHWCLVSSFDGNEAKARGREYKRDFAKLPTVDHVGDGTGDPDFKICSWSVNDAKNDLSRDEFLELCKDVLIYAGYKVTRP